AGGVQQRPGGQPGAAAEVPQDAPVRRALQPLHQSARGGPQRPVVAGVEPGQQVVTVGGPVELVGELHAASVGGACGGGMVTWHVLTLRSGPDPADVRSGTPAAPHGRGPAPYGGGMTNPPVLEAVDLVRRFGSLTAVDHVSLRIDPGETV